MGDDTAQQDQILPKNQAFAQLERASREIEKRGRRHRAGLAGPVPDAWLARREELAQAYAQAVVAAFNGGKRPDLNNS